MKKVVQIVLGIAIIILAYILIMQIMTPVKFNNEVKSREAAVIERLKDIRTAQRAYRSVYQKFTPSMDTLVNFLLKDSMTFVRAMGSADDSAAVASGAFRRENFKVAAIDTVFGTKRLTAEQIKDFPYIPYGEGNKFIMEAGDLMTGSQVVVPVFECRAPYKSFLGDLDEQQLINLIDLRKSLGKYEGIKAGSMTEATNEAGNWE